MLILALAAAAATPMFEAPAVRSGDATWRAAAATIDRAALELTATSCLAKIKTATPATTLAIAVSRSSADRMSIQVTGATTPDAAEASCMRLVGEQVGRGVHGTGELSIEAKLPALPIPAPATTVAAVTGGVGDLDAAFLGADGKPAAGVGVGAAGETPNPDGLVLSTPAPGGDKAALERAADGSVSSGIGGLIGSRGTTMTLADGSTMTLPALGGGRSGPTSGPSSTGTDAWRTATPPMGYGSPIILGALDAALVHAGVDAERSALVACNAALQSGSLVVKFVVAKDGTVSSATVKSVSESISEPLQTCAISAFRRMRFPEPKGGGIVIVSWPLLYRPS